MNKDFVLNLDNFDSIYEYLLSEEDFEFEKKYISTVKNIESKVNYFTGIKKIVNLLHSSNIIFNKNVEWINIKYLNLIKQKITLDLLSNKIIKYYMN